MKNCDIAVIGTGLMGKGISHLFAQNGYTVHIYGRSLDHKDKMMSYLEHELKKGRITKAALNTIKSNLEFLMLDTDLEQLSKVGFVIETIKEDQALKHDLLQKMDRYISEDCLVASNTSTYSITKLGSSLKNPELFLGMHFMSPVPMMNAVEIIRGYRTSQTAIDQALDIVKSIQKESFLVKDTPGFVINRLLVPFFNEASMMMSEGLVSSPKMLDDIMKKAMNLKNGPLELADLIGLDSIYYSMESLYDNFHDSKYRPCCHLKNMVDAGYLGRKTGKGFYDYNTEEKL
ncbi:3-hydroxyacyl-CoA dehydrogenase family protein [Fusibacter sp. 3D3]|uniref:3-hydroxyacyl-CoA dehydrogenase family protein n=1 Tax=Fusibacter sp. 3D3 TaxID=1048380 RepID=UPI000852C927|nr:3-hydroxyacyl-CoA dehydrogenase family protein [Fusibacter sp. 3D3]GAU79286.1 3-hydroxybutyryl-CoA dehydrogenase [Fusibacter sp. 3D3]